MRSPRAEGVGDRVPSGVGDRVRRSWAIASGQASAIAARLSSAGMDTPDALALGGGGTLGEAWMWAVLAGAEQDSGFDARGCGAYVGTSAGSIVAALLAAGVAPETRLEREGA